jgi:hypothetical protein
MKLFNPLPILTVGSAVFAGILLNAPSAQALTFTTYTDSTQFAEALGSAPATVEGYEGVAVNTVIRSGDTLNGLTYNFDVAGRGGRIDDVYTRLDDASLAVERDGDPETPDFFFDGESVRINFPVPVYAVGMFFNSQVAPIDSYFAATPVGTAFTGGTTFDVGNFYFAGLISDQPFTVASFGARGSQSGFTMDNLTYSSATPVPTPALLPGLIAMGFGALSQRRKAKSVESSKS